MVVYHSDKFKFVGLTRYRKLDNNNQQAGGLVTRPSAEIKKRVDKARKIQSERYKGTSTSCNANINAEQFEKVCIIDDEAEQMLKSAFESMGMTARAYDRVLKVARTIADLDNSEIIKSDHILEAVQYRSLDRKYWGK